MQKVCIKKAETFTAVGGAKHPRDLAFRRLVC